MRHGHTKRRIKAWLGIKSPSAEVLTHVARLQEMKALVEQGIEAGMKASAKAGAAWQHHAPAQAPGRHCAGESYAKPKQTA